MVHLPLLVITQDVLDEAALTSLVDPWMGEEVLDENPPIREVDVTDDLRRLFEGSRRWRVTSPDGTSFRASDNRFYREPTENERAELGTRWSAEVDGPVFWRKWSGGRKFTPRIWSLPEGWARRMMPLAEVMTFQDFVTDVTQASTLSDPQDAMVYNGRMRLDTTDGRPRVLRRDRTFPQAGYWRVGPAGPWSFKLKDGARDRQRLADPKGPPEPGYAHQALVGEIDLAGMRDEAGDAAAADWDEVRSIIGPDATWLTQDQARARIGADHVGADAFYWKQPALQTAKAGGVRWCIDAYRVSQADYVDCARRSALSPEAVLKDDLWIPNDLGWLDVARDEQDGGGWDAQITVLLDRLPPETCLTWVDYHL